MKLKNKLLLQLTLIILVTVLLCCTTSNAQTVPRLVENALAATVSLEMQDRSGAVLSRGSGFFVRSNLIATNYHVIEGAAQGTAKLDDRHKKYIIEGYTVVDKTNDLALLEVTGYGGTTLPLGDSNTVRIGETIYVAGNPIGLEGTVSDGIISSRSDRHTKERLQMTAPISPGSSGGPVLNRKGQVIGVSVAGHHGLGVQNLNFAIPSNYLKTLLTQSGIVKPLSQQNQSISAEIYLDRGNDKYDSGDYKGAIADYTQAIRLNPNYADAYVNRGNAKDDLGQHLAAIADYDIAIRLKPDDADTYYNRGNAKDDLGQHLAAIADYDTAIRLNPNHTNAYYNRGLAKMKLEQFSAAIADYDTAIRLKPDYANAYVNRGLAKDDLGQHLAAIADYDTAIRLKPDDADAYYNRGLAKMKSEQPSAAIADYDMAIRLRPDDVDNYFARGLAKVDLEQPSAAIADFDTAIHLKPDFALGYFGRGLAKVYLERFQEAKQDLRTALLLATLTDDENLKATIEALLQKI